MTRSALTASFRSMSRSFTLGIEFSMPLSGITALFGASGSGKTSILRAIAGLDHLPGRLTIDNEIWQDDTADIFVQPHKRAIGYVFQEASLFPHLTVEDNLMFGQRRSSSPTLTGLGKAEIVDLMNIGTLLDRSPATLSGGERQRVAIGRALMRQPRLLLMDEPVSALDQGSRETLLTCLEELHRSQSLPILYVSHDTGEVARLADHMILISDGKKLAEGPASDIFERLDLQPPDGREEASALLEATVERHDGETHLTHLSIGKLSITTPRIAPQPGMRVMLRVRARDVAIATQRPEGISIRNILGGTISEMRRDSASPHVDLLVDIGEAHIRAQVTHDACRDLGLQVGLPVFALVKSMSLDGQRR